MKFTFSASLAAMFFIASILTSCNKKDEVVPDYKIDAASVSIHYDETHTFAVTQGSAAITASTLSWTSTDQTVGTITTDGVFKAKKIGKTTIKGVSGDKIVKAEVTVTPYSTLGVEPYFLYGATKAATKSKETRTLAVEDETGLMYLGENSKVRNVMYLYENGGLTNAALLMANDDALVKEAAKFFDERYQFAGKTDDAYFFTDGVSVAVGIGVDSDLGFFALYYHVAPGSGTAVFSLKTLQSANQKRIQQIKNLISAKQRVN
jgi:hypothetical protein